MESKTCVVFSCSSCGHKEAVASELHDGVSSSYKTLSGVVIMYRPESDSYECPNCNGDMYLDNTKVETRKEENGFTCVEIKAVAVTVESYEKQRQATP